MALIFHGIVQENVFLLTKKIWLYNEGGTFLMLVRDVPRSFLSSNINLGQRLVALYLHCIVYTCNMLYARLGLTKKIINILFYISILFHFSSFWTNAKDTHSFS